MDVPAEDILSTDLMGSDPAGTGTSTALGLFFPTRGSNFAILATGLASDAATPDAAGDLSTELGGLDNGQGNDLVRLHLQLAVPAWAACANFDFAYYSEEFPEFVGSEFNDTFTAQLGSSSLTTEGNQVIAPGNFAFDTQGNIVSVNTVFGVTSGTETTYDGGTPRLQAAVAVSAGTVADIYFSVQDLGDSIYDSAVFLDSFFWSTKAPCSPGAQVDTDSDGLLDSWELGGLSVGGDFVDLPAMGADPLYKDVFVEIDYMGSPPEGGHTHKPSPEAIALVVDAFANAPVSNENGQSGIALHVDYGPEAPCGCPSGTWQNLSKAEQLDHDEFLGFGIWPNYRWADFQILKGNHFSPGRLPLFHYNVWAHSLSSDWSVEQQGTSGISRVDADGLLPASDFIVSLGRWDNQTGTVAQQAGTFMHELGHNLGLDHGGDEDVNYKPNYLSVMNYSFQTHGLSRSGSNGHFDYSRSTLPLLSEFFLFEPAGIGSGADEGTFHFCSLGDGRWDHSGDRVDWNCDGDEGDEIVTPPRDVNAGFPPSPGGGGSMLSGYDDWANLVYVGGNIGKAGAQIELPETSVMQELTFEIAQLIPNPSSPVANDSTAQTPVGLNVTINVLANDSDPDGDSLTVITVSDPPNGSATINPDNTVTYDPDGCFAGSDTFSYTVGDASGNTDTALVTVRVRRTSRRFC